MECIAVSACLLGYHCKYDGGENLNPDVIAYCKGKVIIPICPEVFGGLSTPRVESEITPEGLVVSRHGEDVTRYFERGARVTWELLKQHHCTKAILKDGSPSCGYTTIYDGTFSHAKKSGLGVTARFLKEKGVTFIDL